MRWRYRTIIAKPNGDTELYVISIDGDTDLPILERRLLFAERILLHNYLAGAGEDGWEICGMSPIQSGGNISSGVPVLVILKQPTTNDGEN